MRTAIITGGSGGLGATVTRRFLDDGWHAVVPWVAEKELARLGEHPGLTLVRADLFDQHGAAEVVRAASGTGGDLRAVVNLVGGYAAGERLHATPIGDFETQLRLNLRPTYLTCQAALPALLAAGGGAIVCMASRAAVAPFSGGSGYAVAKAAVLALVDSMAVEYGGDGVRANAILPSVIDTPGNRAAMPDADPSAWVAPEEIAAMIAHLCGDSARSVNGAHVEMYGRA
ncbi:MAG TPA: SDR family oxidoreductase [Streptosporangiaceae bacterium]|jgi:NAD(P)-dependent dehydrogenase (short-subunit alcohol dehydrogenase family)